ncbi:MAG: aldose 1-epimerase family protein [Spirochaetales bacterium]|nr:aldose 1-epimerase family protein [Spirochaetales bacterium]
MSAVHELTKGPMTIAVKEKGAELTRLQLKGHEYLWQGDEGSWTGQSPLLFPLIGGVPGGTYTLDDVSYEIPSHGVLRRRDFSLAGKGEEYLTFRFLSDNETLQQYPFDFALDMTYRLREAALVMEYALTNRSDREMLFSLGAHPAFRCPLEEGLAFEDYRVRFEKRETLSRRVKKELLTGEREPFLNNQDSFALTHNLFNRGALIFDDIKSDRITLESPRGSRKVTMDFTGFPYFGIWKKGGPEGAFLCLEPWYGVDSTEGDSPEWREKEGLLSLGAGELFTASFSVELG